MNKYSKNKLVAKRYVKWLLFIFLILFVLLLVFFIKILTTDKIIYENIDRVASNATVEEATNSTPIILNNILIGAVYNGKWVDSLKYFENSKNKEGIDVDVFNKKGQNGKFNLDKIYSTSSKYDTIYVNIIKNDYISEYYAVASGNNVLNIPSKVDINDSNQKKYESVVKKALIKYNYINNTVKLQEVYNVNLTNDLRCTLIFATNDGNAKNGVYSAIIAAFPNMKPFVVKYNYYKDVNNASLFEVYSFKFASDLNLDGTSEIIIQSTREFTTSYYVLEFKNKKFYQVLESTIAIE